MPFFSQFRDPASTVHHFSNDLVHVVDTAPTGSDVLAPNKSMVHAVASQRADLNVLSFHELITANLSKEPPSKKCYWLQNISESSTCARISVACCERHRHAFARGVWWDDIWIDEQRKFGLEIELTSRDFTSTSYWKSRKWMGRAELLLSLLREKLGKNRVSPTPKFAARSDYTQWQVVYDESAGWEIVSPILCGKKGVGEMMMVMGLMNDFHAFGFLLKQNTGMHIHLSWEESIQTTKRLLHWWYFFEPSIATLVHPSRVFAHHNGYFCKTYNNGYCVPLSQSTDGAYIQEAESVSELCLDIARHTAINPHSIIHKKSVEFRIFEATSDPLLALLWLSLCQQLASLAKANKIHLPVTSNWESSTLTPTGDIVLLCHALMPAGASTEFLNLLTRRRRQVIAHWCKNASLHKWLSFARIWQVGEAYSVSSDA